MHRTTLEPASGEMPAWGVFVFESHHAAGFRMETARHEAVEIVYVMSGAGWVELEGRAVPCRAGDVLIVPVGCAHRLQDDPQQPLALYGVRVHPDACRADPALIAALPGGRLPVGEAIGREVRSEVRRLLFEQSCRRPGRGAMMTGLALQLLVLLTRASREQSEGTLPVSADGSGLLGRVEGYVRELSVRFFEPDDLDSVAARLEMSRRRFTDLFRQVTGTTWTHYLRRLRVGHARQLLEETRRSVVSIAFESGFEDLSSFYRAFQRETGTTPQRWRLENGAAAGAVAPAQV